MPSIPGIIGGIAPESTVDYYRRIVAAWHERVADGSTPRVIITSIDLKRVLDLAGAGALDDLANDLVSETERLARAGADFGLIASNTPHIVFDEVQRRSPIPLVSLVEAACDAAKALGSRKVALFGTRYTMQGRFYPEVFARSGITVVLPSEDEQALIHERYMNELVRGKYREQTRRSLVAIIERLAVKEGVEAVILGGTELPLLLREPSEKGIALLDTTGIHVARVVERMLV